MEQRVVSNQCRISVSINDVEEWTQTIPCSNRYIENLKIYAAGSYKRQDGIAQGEIRYMKFHSD